MKDNHLARCNYLIITQEQEGHRSLEVVGWHHGAPGADKHEEHAEADQKKKGVPGNE